MVQCKKCLIEAHLVKSTAEKQLPKPRGKGTGAEVGAVAGVWLAVRKISVLLSLEFTLAESYPITLPVFSGSVCGSFSSCLFFI